MKFSFSEENVGYVVYTSNSSEDEEDEINIYRTFTGDKSSIINKTNIELI